SPSLYEHLSGAQNLEITRRLKNVERTRIAQVLREVNLTKAANVTVKKYSLGMKQRLGLALALLSRPELLILDEPTNGLDPNGINEIRELLIDLNRATGTTIFLSSHLLAEIEKMASHVGIIFNGSIVVQGIMQELIDSSAQVHMLEIRTNDNQKSMSILQASNFLVLTGSNQMLQIKVNSLQEVGMITKLLVRHEVNIFQILHKRRGLEEIYLSITQS
ncbi:MAG TPA: ABC transporter ATP-binding protein, partial [Flavitalea sp.]|nr:ABC transporter ATP-binding protein [Flavitalea sp.]